MSDKTPSTKVIRKFWSSQGIVRASKRSKREQEFDRWLKRVKADAWDAGFDAGEKDVWMHEEKQDWGSADTKCIPNPYRKGENK